LVVSSLGAAGDAEMEYYLVSGSYIDPGATMPPEAGVPIYTDVIAPSLGMLADWEEAGRIRGGVVLGERAGVFIVQAGSNKAVDEMLQSLPFWGLLDWKITPLVGFRDRLDRDMAHMKAMSEMMQQGQE
jgi:hypothetical protein